ncbi:MAG: branched-chain amino acid aminotransferase [Acidobacteria bacterium]|jgi:branched-chain amino acid aminotransferase|nr:branched-chain amino acid aminotransferase [Acidobacteriota bacterium]MDP7690517.1 aminotransferase class IV [Vicinamibacterales bacterium]HJN45385.1 aminotransferase class IV [Vicinamibacterales bacterium]|tara:strand:- start:2273 stop:3160 length:888 start_codon:yes stop_codon:yes gene_type:complete
MDATVNVNGVVTAGDQAVVSVFDHGFLYGDGVYETLRTYNRHPFLLDRHLARLRASATRLALDVPPTDHELETSMRDTMSRVNPEGEVMLRMLVTRGVGDLTYDPASCPHPTIVIIARAHRDTPEEVVRIGVHVVLASVLRNHPRSVDPSIKSNNLLNNVLAMQEAIHQGAYEAILLNHRGELTECSQSNLFAVRDGVVLTPPLDAGLLEGVTRNFLFEVGREIGVPVREAVLREPDLDHVDELFITSTTREVVPVVRVGERPVGTGRPGPIASRLLVRFRELAEALTGAHVGDS